MNILVVGLGSMGKRRIRNLTHLSAGALAGFDPRADRREETREKYGIPVYEDFEQALAGHQPQVLIISTPPDRHMQFALTALERGIHFFTEAGIETRGLPELVAGLERSSIVGVPSCTMRFQPSVRKMKELVDAGVVGKVLAFTHHSGQYLPDWHPWEDYRTFYVSRRETGACREIVPFELTWINWLFGDIAKVSGMKGKLSDLDCDIDDAYHLLLTYQSGALGHLLVDVVARAAVRHCRILGEKGTLEWNISEKKLRHYDAESRTWNEYPEPKAEVVAGYSEMSAEGMYIGEMASFMGAVRGESTYSHSYASDLRILRVLEASEVSSEQGVHVQLS